LKLLWSSVGTFRFMRFVPSSSDLAVLLTSLLAEMRLSGYEYEGPEVQKPGPTRLPSPGVPAEQHQGNHGLELEAEAGG
jgi:hypothetical protein